MDFLGTARRQMLAGQLHEARERLIESYAGLEDFDIQEPGACGYWSVRDVLAHLASWDRLQTAAFKEMADGQRPAMLDWEEEDNDRFNGEEHEKVKGATLQEVITEFMTAREEMLQFLREAENNVLFAPAPGDEHADFSIAACVAVSASHDEEHAEMIEEWRSELDENEE